MTELYDPTGGTDARIAACQRQFQRDVALVEEHTGKLHPLSEDSCDCGEREPRWLAADRGLVGIN